MPSTRALNDEPAHVTAATAWKVILAVTDDSSGDRPSSPSLSEVMDNIGLIDRLPLDALVDLRRQLRHLDAELDAGILRLMAQGSHRQRAHESGPEQLLTPEAAAARFGVKKRWLLDHAGEIPGVTRLSRKTVRFNERRLARFLERSTT